MTCCKWFENGSCPKHDEAPDPRKLATDIAFDVASILATALAERFPAALWIKEEKAEKLAQEIGPKMVGINIEIRADDREEVIPELIDRIGRFEFEAFVRFESVSDDQNTEFVTKGSVTVKCSWEVRGMDSNPLIMLRINVAGRVA